jgi:hypothetical protein
MIFYSDSFPSIIHITSQLPSSPRRDRSSSLTSTLSRTNRSARSSASTPAQAECPTESLVSFRIVQ